VPRKPVPVRLNKLLAEAGIASRREAERLLADGRVAVNGVTVREPGSSAVPGTDTVTLDGVPVALGEARLHTYLVLHKPRGIVTTVRDPHAERTVMDLLPRDLPRVYPVGRLDQDSEGLVLFTDDGDLTERLLHPRNGVEREYAVLVRGDFTGPALPKLRQGVSIEGERVKPLSVEVAWPPEQFRGPLPKGARWLRIVLAEGRKREVRALCAAVHLYVFRLIRVRFGPLELDGLPPGKTRPLSPFELRALDVRPSTATRRLDPATTDRAAPRTVGRRPVTPARAGARPRRAPARAAGPGDENERSTATRTAASRSAATRGATERRTRTAGASPRVRRSPARRA
jgi:23S rRNA pseudouridine2605 synthase